MMKMVACRFVVRYILALSLPSLTGFRLSPKYRSWMARILKWLAITLP